jgi:hypothetical protein
VAAQHPADVLRRFAAPRAAASAQERCDLCKAALAGEHPHLVDLRSRRLLCACPPCALLFERRGASEGRFKRVGSQRRRIRDMRLGPDFWDRLQIPVRLAFFFENSDASFAQRAEGERSPSDASFAQRAEGERSPSGGRVVAFYPGPAGATESLLPLAAWREVIAENPVLQTLEADVEAMLLRGRESETPECFLVPIDLCYALTGTVRRTWKGFEGGAEAWQEIDGFFAALRATARDVARSGDS